MPNGLLLFDGPQYVRTKGLLIPGKDEKDHPKKRLRVRLNPLAPESVVVSGREKREYQRC